MRGRRSKGKRVGAPFSMRLRMPPWCLFAGVGLHLWSFQLSGLLGEEVVEETIRVFRTMDLGGWFLLRDGLLKCHCQRRRSCLHRRWRSGVCSRRGRTLEDGVCEWGRLVARRTCIMTTPRIRMTVIVGTVRLSDVYSKDNCTYNARCLLPKIPNSIIPLRFPIPSVIIRRVWRGQMSQFLGVLGKLRRVRGGGRR